MNGKKSKAIRRAYFKIIDANPSAFPVGDKPMFFKVPRLVRTEDGELKTVNVPRQMIVNPRRAFYQNLKRVVGSIRMVRGRITGELCRLHGVASGRPNQHI